MKCSNCGYDDSKHQWFHLILFGNDGIEGYFSSNDKTLIVDRYQTMCIMARYNTQRNLKVYVTRTENSVDKGFFSNKIVRDLIAKKKITDMEI